MFLSMNAMLKSRKKPLEQVDCILAVPGLAFVGLT